MPDSRVALLFPGQGAQSEAMLDAIPSDLVNDTLGFDLLDEVRKGAKSIHANLVSSLMTVLASVVSLDLLRRAEVGSVVGAAGYSVGQWVALYAAEAISLEQLIRIVQRRAAFMDDCAEKNPGGMIAVIGIGEAPLEECCAELRSRGMFVAIANYNAVGQYTLAAERRAIPAVMEEIQALKPIKCVQLQTAGPWHSELMKPAGEALAEFLQQETFNAAAMPVIDNTTGRFFDTKIDKQRLADHVYQPVRWFSGIETLIHHGAEELIEVGFGNMLTKFGFFINRQVRHRTFYQSLA